MDSFLGKSGGLAESFVRATAESVAAAVARPRDALRTFLRANPTRSAKRIRAEWRAALDLIDTPQTRRTGIGRFQEEKLVRMRGLLQRIRRLKMSDPLTKLYNNAFVPVLRPRRGKL